MYACSEIPKNWTGASSGPSFRRLWLEGGKIIYAHSTNKHNFSQKLLQIIRTKALSDAALWDIFQDWWNGGEEIKKLKETIFEHDGSQDRTSAYQLISIFNTLLRYIYRLY